MERDSTRQDWDRFWDRSKSVDEIYPASETIIRNLLDVTDVKGKKILEVGGGTGRDSVKLSALGADVYVLDYSDNALFKVREAAKQSNTHVRLIRGDGTRMPFGDEYFDIVFHQGLMEHFRDPLPLFRENVRVLKNGGLLLVDVPQKYHVYTLIKHVLILLDKWFAGWETEYSVGQLRRMFSAHNLSICREYGDYMVPSLFYRMVREAGKAAGVRLPMYPKTIPVLHDIRRAVRSALDSRRFTLNTYLTIGVIGKKV